MNPEPQRALDAPSATRGRGRSDRLGFDAFVLLCKDDYLHYAQARLGDPSAGSRAVDVALQHTEQDWVVLLSRPQTLALAWRILRETVTAYCDARPRETTDDLHRGLPQAQADAVLLHQHLSLPVARAAALMGVEPPIVQADLLMAERLLRRHFL